MDSTWACLSSACVVLRGLDFGKLPRVKQVASRPTCLTPCFICQPAAAGVYDSPAHASSLGMPMQSPIGAYVDLVGWDPLFVVADHQPHPERPV